MKNDKIKNDQALSYHIVKHFLIKRFCFLPTRLVRVLAIRSASLVMRTAHQSRATARQTRALIARSRRYPLWNTKSQLLLISHVRIIIYICYWFVTTLCMNICSNICSSCSIIIIKTFISLCGFFWFCVCSMCLVCSPG